MLHTFSVCCRLVTSTRQPSSPGWGPWIIAPYLLLRRRPLTTLGRPSPTAFAESQWGEPRSDAFGTGARVAGSLSQWLVLLPPCGQPSVLAVGEEESGAGREWQACPSSSSGRGAMLHTFSVCCRLVTSTRQPSSPGWGPWIIAPYLLLRRRPLTTLGHPSPTAFAESQWGEPRSDAFGTGARVAGSLSQWLVLLPPCGQPSVLAVGEEESGAGLEWQACPSSGPGRGAMLHTFSVCCRLVTSTRQPSSPGWGPWIIAPYFLLRRRPLTTLGRPSPTAFAESQWGEPRSDAFGTGARVAGSLSQWLVLLPPCGQPSEKRKAGQGGSGKPVLGRVLAVERCPICFLSVVVESSSPGWRPWIVAPYLLRRHPLTTLGFPSPTAFAESQWGEPRLDAFGTGARVAGSLSQWLVLLPLVGEEEGGAGLLGYQWTFPELEGELPEPIARSLHFLGGGDVLLVTYMDHGVIAWNLKNLEIKWRIRPRSCKIGCSAVSPNEKILAVTNLYDGIDWYSLNSNHFMDASFQQTTTHTTPENVILPITFIHGNSAVLSGTSYGCARITTVKDWALAEKLRHDSEDIVQALAYSSVGDTRQIVTGVAEKGAETVIRHWIQQSGSKKPTELKPRAVGKQGWEYLTTYVRKR
ncbi:hypothetical protein BJY52DRAFT_1196710 [Lactarius psammicola]|nr:hypothetical protein BJY52DRAFT_1196710 [Lactarius psammicola]